MRYSAEKLSVVQESNDSFAAKNEIMNFSILPNFYLKDAEGVTADFLSVGLRNFHSAAYYIWQLPYGRNSDRSNFRLVLKENRGTCSTKHALLAQLALEQGHAIDLVLGIFEMNENNMPAIRHVLKKYKIPCVPEAHCYLSCLGTRVDLTHPPNTSAQPIDMFIYEERIKPDQIGEYKVAKHRRFIKEWLLRGSLTEVVAFEQMWKIREECIAALKDKAVVKT